MNEVLPPQKSLLKVVVLGDAGVGKTSVVKQYVNGIFDPQYKATIGADFLTKDVNLADRGLKKLQIWDTAGQERFRSMAVSFYRGADACVLVYDMCDEKTFVNLEGWMKEFLDNAGVENSTEDFPFVVLGNKADKSDEIVIPKSRAEAWIKGKKNVFLFETSALTKQNLNKAFDQIVLSAGRCLPTVKLSDVQSLPHPDVQDFNDSKAFEELDEKVSDVEDESESPSELEQAPPVVEESRPVENRRDSPDESSKRGRKKSKKKKSGQRSSNQGSYGSSKHSQRDNLSSKNSSKGSRHQQKNNSVRNKQRDSPSSSISQNREDIKSQSSRGSPRGDHHSRRSTPYRYDRNIRLDEEDYSSESESRIGCCEL